MDVTPHRTQINHRNLKRVLQAKANYVCSKLKLLSAFDPRLLRLILANSASHTV